MRNSDDNCKVLHKYPLGCEIQWRGLDFTPLWIYVLNNLVHFSICYLYHCSYKLNRQCLVDAHVYKRQILKIGAPYPLITLCLRMPKIAKNHQKCCPTFLSIPQPSPVELIQLLMWILNTKMCQMIQHIYSQRCEI